MAAFISQIPEFTGKIVAAVVGSIIHNGIALAIAIVMAAAMMVMINPEKLRASLMRRTQASIWGSVALGAFTPFCACGTSAVIIAMLTTTLPWAPIMAFLTSSPLMSPDSFVMLAGIVSVKFAVALTIASVVIGVGSGYLTHLIEKKTSFLKDQVRFRSRQEISECGCGNKSERKQALNSCGCSDKNEKIEIGMRACGCGTKEKRPAALRTSECNCSTLSLSSKYAVKRFENEGNTILPGAAACCSASDGFVEQTAFESTASSTKYKFLNKFVWKDFGNALVKIGLKQILLFYSIFVAVGYLINSFVPTDIIMSLFSANNPFAVPLASLIGFPLYVSGESAIPLINALMAGGAGGGAMLAFMITGQGTSAWVIAGISTFMKKKAIGLYAGFLLAFSIILGYLYDLFLLVWH